MKTIDISKYSTNISSEAVSEQILSDILDATKTETVTLDFSNVSTMATFCSRIIFGSLYKKLGEDDFYEKIVIESPNKTVQLVIEEGIISALSV